MKRLLKWILGILGTVVLIVLTLVGVIWFKPELILNERQLARAKPLLTERGIDVSWANAAIRIDKPSLSVRRILVSFKKLFVAMDEPKFHTRVDQIATMVEVGFRGLVPYWKLVDLDSDVSDVSVDLRNPKKTADKEAVSSDSAFSIPQGLHGGRVRVEVDKFHVLAAGIDAAGTAKISGQVQSGGMEIVTKGDVREKGTGNWGWDAGTKWIIEGESPFHLKVSHRGKQYSFVARLEGKGSREEAWTNLITTFRPKSPGIKAVRTDSCKLGVDWKTKNVTHAFTDCGIVLDVVGSSKSGSGQYLPTQARIQTKLDAQIRSEGTRQPISGDLTLVLQPTSSKYYVGSGEVRAKLGGDFGDFPRGMKWDSDLDLALDVQRFQKLVDVTYQTAFAVPRPLSVMDGPLALRLKGKLDVKEKSLSIPLTISSRLSSPNQRLFVDAEGKLEGSWEKSGHMKLDLDVVAQDVRLMAPPLDVTQPVKPLPDGRFKRRVLAAQSEKPSSIKFDYDVRVRTAEGGAVVIVVQKPEAEIPVQLDMKLSSKRPMNGKTWVRPFALTLFRQEAKIESFSLTTVPNSKVMRVAGKVSVEHGIHKIFLSFFGTEKSVHMDFSSTPPLSKDQIIALLLFGRAPDTLAPEETDSVGNLKSAVAEGAINLFTLYTLASTPIQSINYQASTGVVTTGVRVEDGTVLLLGSDMRDQYRVGLQKRIGKNWWWTSDVKTTASSESPIVSSFIEWVTRY